MTDIYSNTLAQDAYGPVYSAQYGDAVKSAKANELGHRLGIPGEIVESDMPNMLAADRLRRAIAHTRANAAYAQMMANPRLAASGIDDHHLPAVASAVAQHKNYIDFSGLRQKYGVIGGTLAGLSGGAAALAGRLVTGVGDLLTSASGIAHAVTELHDYNSGRSWNDSLALGGLPLAMRLFGKAHDVFQSATDATRYTTSNRDFNDVASGVESIPPMLAALGATVGIGPAGGAAVFGGQGFGDAYEEGRKAGLKPNKAALYGVGDAAIMAGTTFLPEKYLGGVVSGKGGAGKALGTGLGLSEVANILQGLNHWYFIDNPKGVTFEQFMDSLPDQMRSTFVSTLVGLGVTIGAGHIANRIANHSADTQAAQNLDKVMEAAGKSSTRTTNPSDFEAALNQLVGDSDASDIYVPADKVLELFQPQEGKPQRDLHEDPFWGQYASQIEEAGTLGGDVVVPLSAAATHLAGSSDWGALRDFVRTRPGGASMAEVREAGNPEELEALAADVAKKLDEAVPQLKAQSLTQEFAANLGYKGEQADAISQVLGAGMARAYALEKARHEAAGEPTPTMEEFAKDWLPRAEKTTQAAYDASRGSEGVTAEAAQSFSDTQRRGNISIARDSEGLMANAVIRAFEHADFSTAVHETGHFFLEDLKRRALGEGATDQEKADWQSVKEWLGSEDDIPENGHEQFARGFERYIYEGKAPSTGLKAVFAKMRNFMVSLYRSIRAFNSPITPEIRRVMDRLLASDEEIAQRQQELRLGEQKLSELMSEAEQARYAELGDAAREVARDKLYDKVLSTIRAERTRAVAKRKNEIRQEIGDQTDAQPIFRALKLLRSGVPQEDGSTQRATLPKKWLVDNYGEGVLDQLPKGVPPIYDEAHAVDPESLARSAGFESADQLVQRLLAHEEERQRLKASGDNRSPRRAVVEDMTEEKLRSEIGDPFANLEEEADAALANEKQADRLSLELRALSRKTGKPPVPWKRAKAWARAHVRSSTSKDAISGAAMQMYTRAATKAAQNVEEALVAGDYESAFRAKQQQILHLALMSEAKEAKDEVLAGVKRLRKIAKAKTIPSVDQDYLDQAHQLLESVDMKSRPDKAVDRRMAFEAWHAKQVEMEIEPVVPPEYRAVLGQTHWSRLSINDLLDLDKAVKQIVKLGRLKQELKDGQKTRDFNEAKAQMMYSGGQLPPRKTRGGTTDPGRSWIGRTFSVLRSADAFQLKVERLFTWLDNYDHNGPWSRYGYRPFWEAQGLESDMMREYTTGFNAIVKSLPKAAAKGWLRQVDTPELVINNPNHVSNGQAWRGAKDQVIVMALNWGNLGNRQRLLDGFGWKEEDMASVFDRVLTKEDWDFVQKTWDSLEPIGQKLMDLEAEVNGVPPPKVEPASFETPHGTYRGGYFPIVYDPTQTTHAGQAAEDKAAPSGGWWSVGTRTSAAKERVAQVKGRPLLLNMNVLTRHVGEVIHDVTHRQAISQAKKILGDNDLAGVINTRFGPEYTQAARAWVEGIAKPNAAYSRASAFELTIARYLNRAVTAVGLGFRVTVPMIQLSGIPFSAKDLKTPALAEGLRIVTAHPVKAYNEMLERSAEMRARSDAIDATIMDMVAEKGNGKLRTIGAHGFDKFAYEGIAYMDVISRTTVWTSGFNKALKDGMNEDDAVFYADKMVRQSHGIGFQKDRAALQRAHPLVRALYPFFSYQNALYNEFRDLVHRGNIAGGLDYAEIARRGWWIAIIPPLIHAAIHGTWPKDKDGGPLTAKDLTEWLLNQVTLGAVHSLPGMGNIADAVEGGYGYRALNWEELGSDIQKGAGGIKKAVKGEDELHGSAIKSAMTAIGIITAKPLGQIGATAGGLYDYAKGDVHPHNFGDWEKLLTTGKIPDQPVQ